jgi:hypothetical protein
LHLPAKTFDLVDLQGHLIRAIPASMTQLRMDYPAGLYLLKNGEKSIKIMLIH